MVTCAKGHLCRFDSGLVEQNRELFFSGLLRPIYAEEEESPSDAVLVTQVGPIDEWWVAGFDGGDGVIVAFATAFADYILMSPSAEYCDFFDLAHEKIYLSKRLVEVLLRAGEEAAEWTYEDVLKALEQFEPPEG